MGIMTTASMEGNLLIKTPVGGIVFGGDTAMITVSDGVLSVFKTRLFAC